MKFIEKTKNSSRSLQRGSSIMAEFEERDLAESDPSQYSASSERRSLVQSIGFRLLLGLAIWISWYGWGLFKRIGWIPQTRLIDVHISGDWVTGEFRTCQ